MTAAELQAACEWLTAAVRRTEYGEITLNVKISGSRPAVVRKTITLTELSGGTAGAPHGRS